MPEHLKKYLDGLSTEDVTALIDYFDGLDISDFITDLWESHPLAAQARLAENAAYNLEHGIKTVLHDSKC